jgi:hypothetical protein
MYNYAIVKAEREKSRLELETALCTSLKHHML